MTKIIPLFSIMEGFPARIRLQAKKETLVLRARLLESVRRFFEQDGFLEVETPCRVPAVAPEAHIDAVASEEWFLQTSPELCMKRMLCAGYDRIFQVCRCFRKGERGQRHLPEFTLVEWYAAGWDHFRLMAQCEALIRFCTYAEGKGNRISYQGNTVGLEQPWLKMTLAEAFERFGPLSLQQALSKGRFEEILTDEIEPHLGFNTPVFLHGYPAALGALARLDPDVPGLAQRFELYICGVELCNGFSELTDPAAQRRRFEKETARRQASGKPGSPMPETFLREMKWMPECAGNALGFDRLVMLMADLPSVDDGVAFPPESL
jgi:lysyl-tRNA synthetase class 2